MDTMAPVQRMKPINDEQALTLAQQCLSPKKCLTMSKKAFLGNASNKQALIYLLADEMVRAGIHVEHPLGDADYKICQTARAHTITSPVAVVAEDSDVFQLLVHHADPAASNVYMVAANRTVCVTTIKRRVDVQLSESLLFLHAISGCDTTSRPHGIGKVGVLKNYAALEESAATFMASESSKVALEKAGERAPLIMYGSQAQDLKTARLQKFQTKVATAAGYVPPENLPLTSDTARFHSQRVFLQVQAWKGNDLSPEEWGWARSSTGLIPVQMSEPAAPAQLLRNIRCNCGGRCDTRSCTCFKNGLQCTPVCGQCKGIACQNSPQVDREDIDDAADDDI